MNSIVWSRKASKQLLKIPKKQAVAIFEAAEVLRDFSHSPHVKRLVNHLYDYRLRVGNYRVFFNQGSEVRIVAIEEVKKRDDRTY